VHGGAYTHDGGKFYGSRPAWLRFGVDASDMKITWPYGRTTWEAVNAILDRHPPTRSSLAEVTRDLASVGASFEAWGDGTPGHTGNWGAHAPGGRWQAVPVAPVRPRDGLLGERAGAGRRSGRGRPAPGGVA
jgi:hypothetical protein